MTMSAEPTPVSEPRGSARPRQDRRRHCRFPVQVPVLLQQGARNWEGFSRNLSYSGVLVQGIGELPEAGTDCQVTLQFLHGEVVCRGRVTRVSPEENCFAVDLLHVDENGEVLLVVLLMAGSGAGVD